MTEEQTATPNVTVLGLGIMGFAFAHNLVASGLPTTVWNRTASVAKPLGDAGAKVAASPAEAVADADVVVVMLPTADITLSVLDDEATKALKPNAVVAQMGTLGEAGTSALATQLEKRSDVALVDAPVSGTKGPAEAGTVTVLASGNPSAQQRAQLSAVFDVIGGRTVWISDNLGDGTRMKLIVNAWLLSMMQGIAEASILGRQLGVSPDQLWAALDGGPLASPYIKGKLAKLAAENYDAEMGLGWGAKDARLALEAFGHGSSEHLPDLTAIAALWTNASALADADGVPLGKKDISVIFEYLQSNHSAA